MFVSTLIRGETRSTDNVSIPINYETGETSVFRSTVGKNVTEASALGIPAFAQAVKLISGTIGHLPLHYFKVDPTGEKVRATGDRLYRILHDRPNSVHTKFFFFNWLVSRLLIDGRAVALIMRDRRGVNGIIPLQWSKMKVTQSIVGKSLVRAYKYDEKVTYKASEILDFVLLPQADGCKHHAPIDLHRNAIGSIIAAEEYASALFEGGGVPPLKFTGTYSSAQSKDKAHDEVVESLKAGRNRNRNIVQIPTGYDLTPIGIDPAKQQLIEARQFQIAEVARIFNVPPALLHDLTHGTYSNVESQNLAYAQHTITPLIELIEQEMNLKLFDEHSAGESVEFNMDGLQRGALLDRMEAMTKAVFGTLLTPNEARALDNRPAKAGGDDLLIQSAMTKLGNGPIVAADDGAADK